MFQGTRRRRPSLALTPCLLAAALCVGSAAQAEEQTINGFSAWEGDGTVYETGPHTGTFVGAITGTLFILTERGPAAAGHLICPALLEINLQNATQAGEGKCTITSDDGIKVFAEWSCQGVHLVGCDGEIKLTGGTGRMDGVTGSGALSVRTVTQVAVTQAMAGGTIAEAGKGMLILDDLTYSLPDQ
jgi:hypothetical protein